MQMNNMNTAIALPMPCITGSRMVIIAEEEEKVIAPVGSDSPVNSSI